MKKQKTRLRRGTWFLKGMGVRRLDRYISQETDIRARDRLIACRMYKEGATTRSIACCHRTTGIS